MFELMKIGELSQQTGLSIRTLHYYDEIGLLCPSHRTEVGYRLYSNQDIIRLQQIVSLRQLGFSLKEIRECLKNPDLSLQQTIDLHRAKVKEQMALSRTLLKRLDVISTELETKRSVAVDNLIQVMETVSMSKQQYLTPEQQEILRSRFGEREAEWQEILTQSRTEMSKGMNVDSLSVYKLFRRWEQSMRSLIRDDEQIYESLMRMYQQEEVETASWGAIDYATFEYILKAISFLLLADDMNLMNLNWVIPEKNFTTDAIQVIRLAEDAIYQLNTYVIGTEGILLGFLAEDTGVASQVLKAAGVTPEIVQHQIIQILGEFPPFPPEIPIPDKTPFTSRAKRVIEIALEEATQMGQTHIDSGHLLLGILKETEKIESARKVAISQGDEKPMEFIGVAAKILKEALGINLVQLEQQLRSAMSQ
ncbi:MerR family transcriptional regulator [Hyella patelloides LEGE 07179]|uniref:MerR family transcriptional regulator n=1 Tax=Hyella patelloides LEGE 07179 TaxID=945734 RepID=A0A563W2D6_9CYAN|nr:MerR family transcriptional regulator [Hyella patelloides]VEP17869.1 MerR family transcriptional regulator [Hyella patelloides LEGE 07179]